ncbi:meiotically up-regulated protein [Apiospora phragmitis]|uniref:Meiotically up-regulated protein n=1 Tax=Apiospora phragmitis TaxID=2905665 RepID=A0ABR1T976_9PEZI
MAEFFRSSKPAYTARRPVPIISSYVREQQERSAQALSPEEEDFSDEETQLDDDDDDKLEPNGLGKSQSSSNTKDGADASGQATSNDEQQSAVTNDTSEAVDSQANPKRRRKDLGKRRKLKRRREREVTDPVTHLPVRIYDSQASDLAEVDPGALITRGAPSGRLTGVAGQAKSDDDLKEEAEDIDVYHAQLDARFPPPDYEAVKRRLVGVYSASIVIGLTAAVAVAVAYAVSAAEQALGSRGGFLPFASEAAIGSLGFLGIAYAIYVARQWMANRVDDIWEELWHAERNRRDPDDDATIGARAIADIDPASTRWLNDMLSSLWPLVNPDLFFGVADTLEDVMQASIPSIVRMVRLVMSCQL